MIGANRVVRGVAIFVAILTVSMTASRVRAQVMPGKIAATDDFNIQLAEDPQISRMENRLSTCVSGPTS